MTRFRGTAVAVAAALALVGCDENPTGPSNGGTTVRLSVTVPGGGAAPAAGLFAAGLQLEDGTNTLLIESAEVVLREIEFERADELAGCDEDEGEIEGSDDDSCEEYKTDPILLSLPLDGSVAKQLDVTVDAGRYDEIEFDLHKLSGDDPLDQALLSANGDWEDISVRVIGTWNGQPFEYTSDLDAEQEIELATPMDIGAGGATVNVTLSVDVATWFRSNPLDPTSALIDPSSALKDGPNEEIVEDNIEDSFEGFEDHDEDGVPHDEDEDEEEGIA